MSEITSRLAAALADRYTIERELGSGGMATVYLAHDLKHDRKVAIKVLRPELAAAVGAGRFLREIRIEARLQHPHILTLIDSGEADGLLYYVMPYVEGVSLRGKLARDGRFPIPEVVRLLREIVGALAHAHEQGIVHRDVKPDNVLLSGEHHAVVTDFGVAKALGEVVGRQDATTVGLALGTPAYMAPEQAMADPNVDHRADLYALGVVAYEMLTGAPPFAGVTPQATLAAHLTETPDPVAVKRPDVPEGLADLVMRCLEKDPAARWQDARALLQRLETIATPGGTVVPDEAGARRRRGETLAGHPVRWWVRRIGMVVAVLAVLGIAGTWYRARRAETAALLAALAPAVEEGRFDDVYERLRVEGRSLRESPLRNLAAAVGGTLTVRTDPAGAAVRVSRVQPIETFPAHEALQLGRTPVVGFPLVAGEYLVALDGPNLKGVQRLVQIGVGAEALVAATLQPPSADDTDMVPVEAGTVIVAGETSEVAAFLIDEHEVTNEEYVAFIAAGGYRDRALWPDSLRVRGVAMPWEEAVRTLVDRTGVPGPRRWRGGAYPPGEERHPVSGVSWYEAAAFARWAGKQLPTLQQWYRAALTGSGTSYPWGDDVTAIERRANFSLAGTAPVGTYPLGLSPFGCYDMAGNVREWLAIRPGSDELPAAVGGSWQDPSYMFEPSHVETFDPSFASSGLGFRLVRSIDRQ